MATNPDFRDLFVALSDADAEYRALASFGAPLTDVTPDDFAVPGTIFQIGVAPNRIDVITSIDAVEFEEAWSAKVATTYGTVPIHLLSRELLLRNKRAVNRLQDQLDVERLTRTDA